MNFTAQTPQPSLAWTFESSNVDYVTNLAPSSTVQPGLARLVGSAALVTTVAGVRDTAVYFPGTVGSYMNLGTSTPTNFSLVTSNLFVEAWVYLSSIPSQSVGIICRSDTGAPVNGDYRLFVDNTGAPNFFVRNLNVSTAVGPPLSTGVWYHISASWALIPPSSNAVTVFTNGTMNQSRTEMTATAYTSTRETHIGYYNIGYFPGYIRDIRVVQGGVVPTTSFTPVVAPFSYTLPSYVTGSGTTVFTLLGQFVTYNPSGKFGSSIYLDNKNATSSGTAKNTVIYTITSLGLTSNNLTFCGWIKPYYTFPVTGINQNFLYLTDSQINYQIGINSGINQSQIFTFISSSPSVTITNGTNLTTRAWNHYSIALSNVNMTASNTSVAYYFNGTQVGATSNVARSAISVLTNVRLASTGGNFNGGWCELDDLRVYPTALTSTQVRRIYNADGIPSRWVQTNTVGSDKINISGVPLFTQLSPSVASSAVAAFSLRAVKGNSAKAVQVRRSSDDAVLDFWADRLGNLWTAPFTGQLLEDWLGGAAGYVQTWYDQSGTGNHASQATAANQPAIQRATKGPGYAVLFNGAASQVLRCAPSTYSLLNGTKYSIFVTERRNNSATLGGYLGLGTQDGNGTGLITGYQSSDTMILYAHRGDNLNIAVAAFAGADEPLRCATYVYSASSPNKRVYINGSQSPNANDSYDLIATSGELTIGKSFGTAYRPYYYGEMFEVLIFTTSLYDLDGTTSIAQIYNNQLGAYGT